MTNQRSFLCAQIVQVTADINRANNVSLVARFSDIRAAIAEQRSNPGLDPLQSPATGRMKGATHVLLGRLEPVNKWVAARPAWGGMLTRVLRPQPHFAVLTLQLIDGRAVVSKAFVQRVLEELQLRNPAQIISWYHAVRRTDFWRAKISDIAIVATQLYDAENDPTAAELLTRAADEFCRSITAGLNNARQAQIITTQPAFPILITGGLVLNCSFYEQAIRQHLHSFRGSQKAYRAWPDWAIRRGYYHPVVGTLTFALSGRRSLCETHLFETLCQSAITWKLTLD